MGRSGTPTLRCDVPRGQLEPGITKGAQAEGCATKAG